MRSKTSCFNSTLFRKNLSRYWPLWGLASFGGAMFPLAMLLGEQVPLTAFVQGGFALWGNLLYVSVCSTALCYLTWNAAAKEIGPVATSVYLYLMPVVTVAASALLLGERPDRTTLLAVAAILLGLALSQKGGKPSVATG